MNVVDRAYWLAARQASAGYSAEIRAAIFRAFRVIRESLTDAEIAAFVRKGGIGELFSDELLDQAFTGVRARTAASVADAMKRYAKKLPDAGMVAGVPVVAFNVLNPKILAGLKVLDTRVMGDLRAAVREVVRVYVTDGVRAGKDLRAIGRNLREVVGLAPNQLKAIENYEKALRGERPTSPLEYALRDKRYDKLIASGKEMSETQITRAVEVYQNKWVSWNAENIARTAGLDANKLGNALTWQDAADKGVVDADRTYRRWAGVMDSRERPTHVAMEGEVQLMGVPFSNRQMIPGDTEYECRCIEVYFQR